MHKFENNLVGKNKQIFVNTSGRQAYLLNVGHLLSPALVKCPSRFRQQKTTFFVSVGNIADQKPTIRGQKVSSLIDEGVQFICCRDIVDNAIGNGRRELSLNVKLQEITPYKGNGRRGKAALQRLNDVSMINTSNGAHQTRERDQQNAGTTANIDHIIHRAETHF